MPKFRGSTEDWLDNEGESQRPPRKELRRSHPAAGTILPEDANGTVARVFPKQCLVWLDGQERTLLCTYRRASVLGHAGDMNRERSPVAVGDRVGVQEVHGDTGVIVGVCTRRNVLARPAPGKGREDKNLRQVVVANVDVLVILSSVGRPEFNPGLVDRFWIAAQHSGIEVILCVSKVDLWHGEAPPWALYRQLGLPVVEVSVHRKEGLSELRKLVGGRMAAFCGSSGVGKTTLLSALLGREVGKMADISDATGKGKHTTTSAVLLAEGCIDTPGVREFGLVDIPPEQLSQYFPELLGLPCAERGCQHTGEEGCAATHLPRYPSYMRIMESLRAGEG